MSAVALRRFDEPQWPPHLETGSRFSKVTSEPVRVPRAHVSAPTTSTEPTWLLPTLTRMRELALLGYDWDSRGSAEVRHDALSFAMNVLGQVMPPDAPVPGIVALGHGGIQLLWHNDASDLEVEVIAPNEVVFYHLDKSSGVEYEAPLSTEFSAVTNILWSCFRT